MPGASRLLILAFAMVASVGLKLAILRQEPGRSAEQELVASKIRLAHWLARQGFDAVDVGESDSPFISASAAPCELTVLIAHPAGFHRALVRRLAGPAGEHFFLYRGERLASQPVWRTWLDHQLWQRGRDIGIAVPRRPLIAVIGSRCSIDSFPWAEAERLAAQ